MTPTFSRNPWLAGLLSLLAPGLGQLYCGRISRAFVVFVTVKVMAVLGLWLMVSQSAVRITLISGCIVILAGLVGPIIDAAAIARRTPASEKRSSYQRWYVYVGVMIVSVTASVLIADARRTFARSYVVSSGAMEPSLLAGDYITVARRISGTIKRNDVVVFTWSNDAQPVLMRVVANPGDTILMRHGVLHVNGESEPARISSHAEPDVSHSSMLWQSDYLASGSAADYKPTRDEWGPLVVPADQYFVLGDNRHASLDSRYRGFVPREQIRYVARNIYYSKQGISRIGTQVR